MRLLFIVCLEDQKHRGSWSQSSHGMQMYPNVMYQTQICEKLIKLCHITGSAIGFCSAKTACLQIRFCFKEQDTFCYHLIFYIKEIIKNSSNYQNCSWNICSCTNNKVSFVLQNAWNSAGCYLPALFSSSHIRQLFSVLVLNINRG